jgi:predicted GNAT family acetyltransferase
MADELAVVSRLFVDPEHIGRGVGGVLLQTVIEDADRHGEVPVLDMLADHTAVISFYESTDGVRRASRKIRGGKPSNPSESWQWFGHPAELNQNNHLSRVTANSACKPPQTTIFASVLRHFPTSERLQ